MTSVISAGVPEHEGTSELRAGDPDGVPEQEQDAGSGATGEGKERAGRSGGPAKGTVDAKGEKDLGGDRTVLNWVVFISDERGDADFLGRTRREDQDTAPAARTGNGHIRRGVGSAWVQVSENSIFFGTYRFLCLSMLEDWSRSFFTSSFEVQESWSIKYSTN